MASAPEPATGPPMPAAQGRSEATHLLVRAGEYVCALPLAAVRRVVRALPLHPLPGSAPELRGLAEFAGEPLPVLDLARLARAPQGANPTFPVTVVAWAGPRQSGELVGLAADAALDVIHLPLAAMAPAVPAGPPELVGPGAPKALGTPGAPMASETPVPLEPPQTPQSIADGPLIAGEALAGGQLVRVINLQALGQAS